MSDKPVVRQRPLPRSIKGGTRWVFNGTEIYNNQGSQYDLSGTQKTVSEGHPVSQLGKTNDDIGGNFDTYKSEIVWLSHPSVTLRADANIWFGEFREFQGCLIPRYCAPLKREDAELRSDSELEALGSTAISRCSPVNSHSELLTSLAETIKDGLPAIPGAQTWRVRTATAKDAGSEYLNAQFGWIPLVNDIRSAVKAAKHSAELLDQFKRDAGRNVRRTYRFPPVKETTEWVVNESDTTGGYIASGEQNVLHSSFFPGGYQGKYTVKRELERKLWFSGAFTYHLPASDTQVGKMMSALQQWDLLFGVTPTPDVLWNLTPWSWATDWFANTGDIMTNVSNAQLYGQVLRYGYIMEKSTMIDRHVLEVPGFMGPKRIEAVVKTTSKRRRRATPFGFGITFDGFDAYQLSILAALGITRGRNTAN